jgi:hemolysin III
LFAVRRARIYNPRAFGPELLTGEDRMQMEKSQETLWTFEEVANTLTHGVGLLLSIAALAALVMLAWQRASVWHFTGCAIYGATQVILYAASTLYHGIQTPHLKHRFRQIDQIAIYLLIAGTYTPFLLVTLRGFWGYLLLTIVWGLAVFGIVFKLVFVNRYKAVTMVLYLAIGWAAIIAIKPIFALVPPVGLAWIGAGGSAYMLGLVFFAWERLPFNHVIWHIFVLAGSGCFFLAVLNCVLPRQA